MERAVLHKIAQAKLDDAEALFQAERFSNAYYLFGYAAEIGLKARIAASFVPDVIPDKKFVNDIYSHDLNKLVGLAGLTAELAARRQGSAVFDGHWSAVSDWLESSRYEIVDEARAIALRNAMMDDQEGIFEWLRAHW